MCEQALDGKPWTAWVLDAYRHVHARLTEAAPYPRWTEHDQPSAKIRVGVGEGCAPRLHGRDPPASSRTVTVVDSLIVRPRTA